MEKLHGTPNIKDLRSKRIYVLMYKGLCVQGLLFWKKVALENLYVLYHPAQEILRKEKTRIAPDFSEFEKSYCELRSFLNLIIYCSCFTMASSNSLPLLSQSSVPYALMYSSLNVGLPSFIGP